MPPAPGGHVFFPKLHLCPLADTLAPFLDQPASTLSLAHSKFSSVGVSLSHWPPTALAAPQKTCGTSIGALTGEESDPRRLLGGGGNATVRLEGTEVGAELGWPQTQ